METDKMEETNNVQEPEKAMEIDTDEMTEEQKKEMQIQIQSQFATSPAQGANTQARHPVLMSIGLFPFYLRNTFQLGDRSYCCRNILRK